MAIRYLISGCVLILTLFQSAATQEAYIIDEQYSIVNDEVTPQDTSIQSSRKSMDNTHAAFRDIDAGYRLGPVHPYFRDEYRIIRDVRRLVRFVDRGAIRGLESMQTMFEIVEEFPDERKSEMIGAAVSGSIANFASEMVSKHLRRNKLDFVQWQLEKLVFSSSYHKTYLRVYKSPFEQGVRIYDSRLRLNFSYRKTQFYVNHTITFYASRSLGFNFMRHDGRTIFGPYASTGYGRIAFSYDRDLKIFVTSFNFRETSAVIIRFIHYNYLRRPQANFLQGEIMLRW